MQLALALGYASPRRMLREMTRQEWADWRTFLTLEPLEAVRMDYRIASVVQILANINRGKNQPAIKIEDCIVRLGDATPPVSNKQTWQEKKKIFFQMIMEQAQVANQELRERNA
jgi:hypothetical protein